jgi:hypothetical protein
MEDGLLTRRTALKGILNGAAGLALRPVAGSAPAAGASTSGVLRLGAGAPIPLADDFIGLGYEMLSVAPLGLLSADNRPYVALVNGLGPRGVIRVGGIVADYTRFDSRGTIVADPHNTVITEASLQQFAGFLEKIGWRAIWSLNFAQGSLADAVLEARAVEAALGSHLLAFELGNEVENYGRGRHPFRLSSWDYAAYRSQYQTWHAAITKAVPRARFAAPDTASSVEWVENMARDADGEVQLLTTHYYRTDRTRGSAEQLLTPGPRLDEVLARLHVASQQSGLPWRMCETNSFSGGGLPGVSDTLIGALWTLDFMLRLAAHRCSGVNLETGVNQLGFLSSYSPIRTDSAGHASAGAPYYGMLAFAVARRGCTHVLSADAHLSGINATVYVLGRSGQPRSVVIVNRNRSHEALVSLRDLPINEASVLRLIAPSAESTDQVSFGGSPVDADGHWAAAATEEVRRGILRVPAMSAVVASSSQFHR